MNLTNYTIAMEKALKKKILAVARGKSLTMAGIIRALLENYAKKNKKYFTKEALKKKVKVKI